MSMTKVVFFTVIAVLAAVLYSIPSHADNKGGGNGAPSHGANATPAGTPSPNDKATENSNGQFQSERKFGMERANSRKSENAKTKTAVPPAEQQPKPIEQPK